MCAGAVLPGEPAGEPYFAFSAGLPDGTSDPADKVVAAAIDRLAGQHVILWTFGGIPESAQCGLAWLNNCSANAGPNLQRFPRLDTSSSGLFTRLSVSRLRVARTCALTHRKETSMRLAWAIVAVLLILWLLGFSLHVAGSLIHLLVVLALAVLIIDLLTGRRSAV